MMYHMVHVLRRWLARTRARRLLNAAIDHIAARGISDLSLRELAAAIGTSHRMLIHHFGSREGALGGGHPRRRGAPARRCSAEVVPDPRRPRRRACAQWWRHISDPSLWPNERLFFEIYGQALQGRPGTVELLDGIVDAGSSRRAEGFVAFGRPARGGARAGAARRRRHAAGCCSTCSPPATARPSTPRWRRYIALVEARLAGYPGRNSAEPD